jgi:hypothetical protein
MATWIPLMSSPSTKQKRNTLIIMNHMTEKRKRKKGSTKREKIIATSKREYVEEKVHKGKK